jgi:hypothetical protein
MTGFSADTKKFYESIVRLGIEHHNNESDLYVPITEETTALLKECLIPESSYSTFTSNIDGDRWYNVYFAYIPWWDRLFKRVRPLSE